MSRIAMDVVEPIYHDHCWECPICHVSNEPPNIILTSMPPQTPYYCMGLYCNYRYHWVHELPEPEYPIGEIIVGSKVS